MRTLIENIGLLVGIVPEGVLRKAGKEMAETGALENAWLLVEDGLIADFGEGDFSASLEMTELARPLSFRPSEAEPLSFRPSEARPLSFRPSEARGEISTRIIDAEGGMVMPAFCDSHTHIVYAGSREGEFLDKINGLSYEEIAARGGGILNSADLLHRTSEDELYEQSMVRVREMVGHGTLAMEIKSGYGLNPEDELKMLRVIDRIRKSVGATVRSTFLGAHAVGRGYTHEEYVRAVIEMTPDASRYADFIDVFCDEGFFTPEDTERILKAGAAAGLRPKIHANELAVSGGVEVGVRNNALSVDHLERTTEAQIKALKGSETMPVMLPGSSFFLGIPFGNARGFIDAGLPLALASDYNPGSSPSGDMRFVMALACIRQKLTPVEAFNAVTLNGAAAMGLSDAEGSITPGKRAHLILTQPGWNLTRLAYQYRTPWIREVII